MKLLKYLINLFLICGFIIGTLLYKFENYPNDHIPLLTKHFFTFYSVGLFFVISLNSLGKIVRQSIISSKIWQLDILLGLGLFSWVLAIFNKISINFLYPFIFLIFLFIHGLYSIISNFIKQKKVVKLNLENVFVINIFFYTLLSLSIIEPFNGFLFFSVDFDSGFFHIVLPQAILTEGYHFSPPWTRGSFIPQLTHNLYIFLLSFFENDFFYLKIFNFLIFIQLYVIFLNPSGKKIQRILGSLFFLSLSIFPEIKNYIVNTNLDAIFCGFMVSIIYIFLNRKKNYNELKFIVILSGFAIGQKHFGIMYTFPILLISFLSKIHEEKLFVPTYKNLHIIKKLFYISLILPLVVVPFYFHNVIAGSNLFFPFLGSWENNIGWTIDELKAFTGATINHWGHSKTIQGFFFLPYHLISFPDEYQFFLLDSLWDYQIPLFIYFLYFSLFISLVFLSKDSLIVSIVLLTQLIFWYKGSQVIRYLLPINLSILYYIYNILINKIIINHSRIISNIVKLIMIFLVAILIYNYTQKINYKIPVTNKEREEFTKFVFGKQILSNYWLINNTRNSIVMDIGPIAIGTRYIFPSLRFCSDWYATCAYNKYINGREFKEWKELKPEIMKIGFTHIVVHWNQMPEWAQLEINERWQKVIPNSTMNCLKHVYFNNEHSDIFEIKKECLR